MRLHDLGTAALALLSLLACRESPPRPSTPATEPSPPTVISPPPPPTPDLATRLALGIDVSSHSGAVDWSAIPPAGFGFAVVKASEGVDLPDPKHDDHWTALAETGLLRGAYHFYVTEDDPDAQADLFLEAVRLEPGDLAPVVDVEILGHGTEPGLDERLRRFLDRLEARYRVKPIIYTQASFWNAHLPPTFGDYPLWVAEYEVEAPKIPHGWSDWDLWQYKDDHDVAGVERDADLSRVNPALGSLEALVIP